jgi:ribosomal protein S11
LSPGCGKLSDLTVPEGSSSTPDKVRAEEMLRALYEHAMQVMGGQPASSVRELIHPHAEMRLFVSFRKPVHGRAAVVRALETGLGATVFRATVLRIEWLDDVTSLTHGHARYALERGGTAEGDAYWLGEFRDGLIWRVQAFESEAAARQAYGADR